ncbi:diaminopimelate epimerase [Coralloluteibacterium thermophilus]|uniref:Diaminopimelate epimerase n=1 Tax=Coralloluteibacterium thermophilum TaxID=2707049 RepID=A0ABV9NN40_9GAMM
MNAGVPLRFTKMHGAGNDFVILDCRGDTPAPDAALAAALADRHRGVGCDQVITVEPARSADCVAAYRIWNADGSVAGQCGNGARCVAAWLVRDGAARGPRFALDAPPGRIEVEVLADGRYRLGMGVPDFEPAHVPYLHRGGPEGGMTIDGQAVRFDAVSMGNPHAVLEVDRVDLAPVAVLGPGLQARPEFPESVNVGFAQVLAPDRIALRVYERGAGETLACGSGACAAAAALMRRGRVGRRVVVALPGGELEIDWPRDDAPLTMTGPVAFVFEGEWPA